MGLTKEAKEKSISQFRLSAKDTGSVEVQVALLTQRISEITEHLSRHTKDHASRLGLIKMVGKRRRLLGYLSRESSSSYSSIIKQLGLRR
ncbi:MAG: 30S ribosomal protein S15 [Chloroflexota bacterium]